MLKKLTFLEWISLLALLFLLSLFFSEKLSNWRFERAYERRISTFDQFDQNQFSHLVLPANRIVMDDRLSGRWVQQRKYERNSLVFSESQSGNDDKYRVEFDTHSCVAGHSRELAADYRDGKVLLSRPVAESGGPVYQQLYCVRVGNRRVLIPDISQADLTQLLKAIHRAEDDNQWSDLHWWAYVPEN